MNDFDDDFDSLDDNEFNDFNEKSSLKDTWNNSPLLKIFTIIAGVILVIVVISMIGGGDDDSESRLSNAPDDREVLGGEVSQNYANVLEEVNEQRLQQAVQTGSSTIPMLVNPEDQELLTDIEQTPPYDDFDPLATFRAATAPEPQILEQEQQEPELVMPQQVFQQPQQVSVPAPSAETVQALAQAMAKNVDRILENHTPMAGQIVQVTPVDYYQQLEMAEAERQATLAELTGQMVDTNGDGIVDTNLASNGLTQNGDTTPTVQNIIIPAGSINYGQILTEANSDIPGPVLAQLVSGPLAGARLIGDFTVTNKKIVLTFNSIVVNGVNQPINAIAIDPDTTLPGVATEVDNRYWSRVLLPAAAKFVEGIGAAIAEDSETTVTVSGDTVIEQKDALDTKQELGRGVEEGLSEVSDFMTDAADEMEVLVRVAKGTPVGIFFTEPVLEE